MVLKRIGGAFFVSAFLATSILLLGSAPAKAAKAEPTISSLGWWWEDATTEEREVPGVGTVTIETPNPFCPSAGSGTGAPVSQACSEGRLPIEVRNGDYEQQNKISAVAFDLSLIPVGSEVNKFTVTFREAMSGCYDRDGELDDDPNDDVCETTNPLNAEGHELQACLVTAFFGDAEARPLKEAPKYECSNGDPIGKRKEVASDKDGEGSNFYWTFDLTEYAKAWTAKFTPVTGIMLVGKPVEGEGNQATETWRVVLTGPNFQQGIQTAIDYIPSEDPLVPPVDPGTDPGTGTLPTDTGTGFDTGVPTDTGDLGDTGDVGDVGGTDPGATPTPTAPPLQAVSDQPQVQEIPGYLWLALIAGLVGFSLVRSVVIEKTTGIRPNGVLATIHRLNAERAGSVVEGASAAGPLAAVSGAFAVVGKKIGGAFGKLNFRKKG